MIASRGTPPALFGRFAGRVVDKAAHHGLLEHLGRRVAAGQVQEENDLVHGDAEGEPVGAQVGNGRVAVA
ncbi:MAG: hypothetical protein IPN03_05210 [Holophagales bacterium]|nr:hypothetical protein [Holophagales bacterium]